MNRSGAAEGNRGRTARRAVGATEYTGPVTGDAQVIEASTTGPRRVFRRVAPRLRRDGRRRQLGAELIAATDDADGKFPG